MSRSSRLSLKSRLVPAVALASAVIFGGASAEAAPLTVAHQTRIEVASGVSKLPAQAPASTVRPGAGFGQVDMLLDAYETDAARRSYWAANVICWNSGFGNWIASLTQVCPSMVAVCSAQAYYASPRKRAGITYTYWGSAWCWKY